MKFRVKEELSIELGGGQLDGTWGDEAAGVTEVGAAKFGNCVITFFLSPPATPSTTTTTTAKPCTI